MIVRTMRILGKGRYPYRPGEVAEVVGLMNVKPDNDKEFRPCLLCLYPDGETDYVALSDVLDGHYAILEST